MKITIKKIYIGGLTTFLALFIPYYQFQEFISWLSHQSLTVLILPSIFLASLIYSVNFWLNTKSNEQITDKASKETSDGDPIKENQIKEHLWQKYMNDAYTLNFYKGQVRFTTNWYEQKGFDSIKTMPKVVRDEINKKKGLFHK